MSNYNPNKTEKKLASKKKKAQRIIQNEITNIKESMIKMNISSMYKLIIY